MAAVKPFDFQLTTQPTKCRCLVYDLRCVWQSPRVLHLITGFSVRTRTRFTGVRWRADYRRSCQIRKCQQSNLSTVNKQAETAKRSAGRTRRPILWAGLCVGNFPFPLSVVVGD